MISDEYLHRKKIKTCWFRETLSASCAILNKRLQTLHVTMLVGDVLLQLFDERYQVIHLRHKSFCAIKNIREKLSANLRNHSPSQSP